MIRPDHALVVGFTEAMDPKRKDIAFAIRIPFGYSSRNACLVARDVLYYYFGIYPDYYLIKGEADISGMIRMAVRD